jgi:hypothetical protein
MRVEAHVLKRGFGLTRHAFAGGLHLLDAGATAAAEAGSAVRSRPLVADLT